MTGKPWSENGPKNLQEEEGEEEEEEDDDDDACIRADNVSPFACNFSDALLLIFWVFGAVDAPKIINCFVSANNSREEDLL